MPNPSCDWSILTCGGPSAVRRLPSFVFILTGFSPQIVFLPSFTEFSTPTHLFRIFFLKKENGRPFFDRRKSLKRQKRRRKKERKKEREELVMNIRKEPATPTSLIASLSFFLSFFLVFFVLSLSLSHSLSLSLSLFHSDNRDNTRRQRGLLPKREWGGGGGKGNCVEKSLPFHDVPCCSMLFRAAVPCGYRRFPSTVVEAPKMIETKKKKI